MVQPGESAPTGQPATKRPRFAPAKNEPEPAVDQATLAARVAALESALASERAGGEGTRAKLSFLTEKVRTVAERSKARGQMLVRLIAAQKKVDTAKEAVEAAKASHATAEAELQEVLQAATALMAEEETAAGGGGGPSGRRVSGAAAGAGAAAAAASPGLAQQQPTVEGGPAAVGQGANGVAGSTGQGRPSAGQGWATS